MKPNLEWGLTPDVPEGAVAWGARAILERHPSKGATISLMWDRSDCVGPDDPGARQALADWINRRVQEIDAWDLFLRHYDSGLLHSIDDGRYHMMYDTRSSCGYVYFAAWRDPE